MKKIRVLFIGNSHTYVNGVPKLVRDLAAQNGIACGVTMITHPGWKLSQHLDWPEAEFNILYGDYDYVVLQEHTHPFIPHEEFYTSVRRLVGLIRQTSATPVLYMTWAEKTKPENQAELCEVFTKMAAETGALLAPVGVEWWKYRAEHPDAELYSPDGGHASPDGSALAARVIFETIAADLGKN